jgi:hypothetical protein
MTDLLLDETGDLALVDGQLVFVDGVGEVRQSLQQSLRFLKADWFLDERLGVPYRALKEKGFDLGLLRSVITKVALQVTGIVEVLALQTEYESTERAMRITISCRLDPTLTSETFTWTFRSVIV